MSLLRSTRFRRLHAVLTVGSIVLLVVNLIDHDWLQVAVFAFFLGGWVEVAWLLRFIERHQRERE